jgi:hypothetical protein
MAANLSSNSLNNGLSTPSAATKRNAGAASSRRNRSTQTIGDTVSFQRKPNFPSLEEQRIAETRIGRALISAYRMLKKPWAVFGHPLTGLFSTLELVGPTIYNRTPLKGLMKPYFSKLPPEQYVPNANHEMGHALTSAAANLEMNGLYLYKHLNTGGAVDIPLSVQKLAEADPKIAAKYLVVLLSGHAAELNRSTVDELASLEHRICLLTNANPDFAASADLLKKQHQAFNLQPDEIPDLNNSRLIELISDIGAANKLPADKKEAAKKELIPKLAQELNAFKQFQALPVIKDGIETAQKIHGVLSADKREQLIQEVADKKFYRKSKLYDLLDRHVTEAEGRQMVQHLEEFVQKAVHI